MGEGLIEKLSAAGITTVEALADMTPEQLEAIEGIGPKTVEKISLAVNNYFSSLDAGVAGRGRRRSRRCGCRSGSRIRRRRWRSPSRNNRRRNSLEAAAEAVPADENTTPAQEPWRGSSRRSDSSSTDASKRKFVTSRANGGECALAQN